MKMKFTVETKSTDGVGNLTDWTEIAKFVYVADARAFAAYIKNSHGEEAEIDRRKVRIMEGFLQVI